MVTSLETMTMSACIITIYLKAWQTKDPKSIESTRLTKRKGGANSKLEGLQVKEVLINN